MSIESELRLLREKVEELSSKEEIRECLYRINRGMDRIDRDLMGSGFHPDAKVRWGTPEALDVATWLELGIQMQHKTSHVQHLIGNVLIDLRGDIAHVESYEIGRHLTPIGSEKKDLILAARYVDRFSRRNGVWKIEHREKVLDWGRIMEGTDPIFESAALKGLRDTKDVSYSLFGAKPFYPK